MVNLVLMLLPPSRMFGFRSALLRAVGVDAAPSASVCGRGWVYGRGRLTLGRNTWLSAGVVFHTHLDAAITIGDECDIGPDVLFIIGSHEPGPPARRAGRGTARPITVGNGCWIGARCTIVDGVTIGDGCVIAAGSVVTDHVPAHTLSAGVPARVKKSYA